MTRGGEGRGTPPKVIETQSQGYTEQRFMGDIFSGALSSWPAVALACCSAPFLWPVYLSPEKDGMQWLPGQASEILTERVGAAASLGGSKRLANCQPSPRMQKLRRSFAARSQFRHTDKLMSSTTQLALRAPAPVSKANTDDDNRLSSSSIYGWLVWISNSGPLESV